MLNRVSDQLNTLCLLHQSNFDFYLTGSRFFLTHTNFSDYDFYTECSGEVVEFLDSLGFVEEARHSHYYHADLITIQVFHLATTNIHVQLIQPLHLEVKHRAQAVIKQVVNRPVNKEVMRFIWQTTVRGILGAYMDK